LQRELRDRLRDGLGMPPRIGKDSSTPAEVANRRGLNPSFDLPASAADADGQVESKHADSFIQTLLFNDVLDLSLSRIREHVRLSLDEAGVNPLFCVFGFLEWYEDGNSETPLHAPLLVYPLNLDRELVRGNYQYAVRSTGDGAAVNVALFERLKRDFEVELPSFNEEEDTPERYLKLVQAVIDRQKGWRVRRWVTIGLFSFARIAMYRDLDDERWQSIGGLHRHNGLGQILAGGAGDGISGANAATDDVPPDDDRPTEIYELDTPLIADADSSQLRAIQDVISGRSLIIEGPPGTGKSQTITNIIAAALAAGKTVLFVAEKMAALNVVKDRLKEAQLELFCLELHSTKGTRRETFSALAQRLNFRTRTNVDSELNGTLQNLRIAREKLGNAAVALGLPAGSLGITTQELLWRCQRLRAQTATLPGEIDELVMPNADSLTNADLHHIVLVANQLEKSRASLLSAYGSARGNPWYGVARGEIGPMEADDLVRRAAQFGNAASESQGVLNRLTAVTQFPLQTIADLKSHASARAIPEPEPTASEQLIMELRDPQVLATMEQFAEGIAEHLSLMTSCHAVFNNGTAADAVSPKALNGLSEAALESGLGNAAISEIAGLARQRERQAEAWLNVSKLASELADRAGAAQPLNLNVERAIVAAVDAVRSADATLLRLRTRPLVEAGASEELRKAVEIATAISQRRARLSERFTTEGIIPSQVLRGHAIALRAAPAIAPFLSLEWWRARAVFKGICKVPIKLGRGERARALDEIASLQDEMKSFAENPRLKELVGAAFTGVDFDLKPLLRVAEWADRIRSAVSVAADRKHDLLRFFYEAPADQIEAFADLGSSAHFKNLVQALSSNPSLAHTTADQADRVRRLADGARSARDLADRSGLRPELRCSELRRISGQVERLQSLRDALDNSLVASRTLGNAFQGHKTNVAKLLPSVDYVRAVVGASVPAPLKGWLLEAQPFNRIKELKPISAAAEGAVNAMENALEQIQQLAPVDLSAWLGAASVTDIKPAELAEHAARCANDAEGLNLLIDDMRRAKEARETGLGALIDLLDAQGVPLVALDAAARRLIYQSLVRSLIAKSPALVTFTGERFEAYRKQFRELDHRLKRLRQAKIADELARRHIEYGNDRGPKKQWTGRALIQNEVGKQKRHVPTRDLLERSGRAVQQLMPCFMMSPLSVAQFLKPGVVKFDLVVMDEASQLRPQDTIGAIARGSQLVIVGDPKQLPPTNFFMGEDGVVSDDEEETAAQEQSILDHAIGILRPVRRLKWHYRSRHPSLIAFSNKEFYGDDPLILFPSPYHEHDDFGVKYVHVEEGRYGGRVNVPEARRVATAAIDYAAKHPERSLGIVALNQPQRELIELEVDRLAQEHEEFEAWRKKWDSSLERFFVKNLENVQGDERDTIFISTVFGRGDDNEVPHQRFGPINNEGGHRRLNVLFTRAKFQTVVFCSMDPAQIRTDEKSKWGVRALKGYLKFAKDGLLEGATETGRAPDSDFEVAVADALHVAGYEAVPQIGVAGYFIDIGVRHPERPGEFVLGVECDGAAYHSTKSARDRDRLRQEVLERLQWRIHRIWSLDWYRNHRRETDRLVKAVRDAVAVKAL
jgi:hypothetical protein